MNELYELMMQIEAAKTVSELKACHEKLAFLVKQVVISRDAVSKLCDLLSNVHDSLVKKTLYLAEQAVVKDVGGKQPSRWCWYVMGSMGRREQTVWTDQDNGILFQCQSENEGDGYEFIRRFSEIGVKYLYEIGYPYCTGNVMATNRRWRKSISEWCREVNDYIANHSPDDIRFLLIAVDMRRFMETCNLWKRKSDI